MGAKRQFSSAQCRAARGLLSWEAADLAKAASLEAEAVELFEAGEGDLGAAERERLQDAFNEAGVTAVDACRAGEGVRFRSFR